MPGDVWLPKPRKAGKELRLPHPMKGSIEVACEPLTVYQIHSADRAVLAQMDSGRLALIKWRDLRKNWNPETDRKEVISYG